MRASVVHAPAAGVEPREPVGARLARDVEHDGQVRDHAQRLPDAAHPLLRVPDLGEDRRGGGVVERCQEHHVGGACRQLVGDGRVREGGHHRLPLRRARRDRRAAHREPRRLDVDAVHLVAVDEPAGRRVADLGVVLPAVPERADGLDEGAGLVEPLGDLLQPAAGQVVREGQVGEVTAARERGVDGQPRHPHLPAGASAARVVEGGQRLGHVERLGVDGGDDRDEAHVRRRRGHACGRRARRPAAPGPGRSARPPGRRAGPRGRRSCPRRSRGRRSRPPHAA